MVALEEEENHHEQVKAQLQRLELSPSPSMEILAQLKLELNRLDVAVRSAAATVREQRVSLLEEAILAIRDASQACGCCLPA